MEEKEVDKFNLNLIFVQRFNRLLSTKNKNLYYISLVIEHEISKVYRENLWRWLNKNDKSSP